MIEIVRDFCSDTNLHGFIYIVQPSRHKIERIFWSVSIFGSFILTLILIIKFIFESQSNPIVIYTDQNVINVEDINFPAVSVCPGVILKAGRKNTLDYKEIMMRITNETMDIEELTENELKLLQVASLIANDRFMSINFPNLSIPTDDFIEKLGEFEEFFDDPPFKNVLVPYNFGANWTDKYPVFMTQNLWKFGFCHTFNFPNSSEIFRMEK